MIFTADFEKFQHEPDTNKGKLLIAFPGDSVNRREQMKILTNWTSKDPGASVILLLSCHDPKSFLKMYDIKGVPAYLLFQGNQLIIKHVGEIGENRLDQWFENKQPISNQSLERIKR